MTQLDVLNVEEQEKLTEIISTESNNNKREDLPLFYFMILLILLFINNSLIGTAMSIPTTTCAIFPGT